MNIFIEIYPKSRFDTPYEHEVFERNLKIALSNGNLKEISAIKEDGKILLKCEKWFLCEETGIIYKYNPPNYPDRGVWEPVDNLSDSQSKL